MRYLLHSHAVRVEARVGLRPGNLGGQRNRVGELASAVQQGKEALVTQDL